MLFSVEQAFVGREEIRAPLKTPAWEARLEAFLHYKTVIFSTDLNTNWHKFLKRSTFSNFLFVEIIMHPSNPTEQSMGR